MRQSANCIDSPSLASLRTEMTGDGGPALWAPFLAGDHRSTVVNHNPEKSSPPKIKTRGSSRRMAARSPSSSAAAAAAAGRRSVRRRTTSSGRRQHRPRRSHRWGGDGSIERGVRAIPPPSEAGGGRIGARIRARTRGPLEGSRGHQAAIGAMRHCGTERRRRGGGAEDHRSNRGCGGAPDQNKDRPAEGRTDGQWNIGRARRATENPFTLYAEALLGTRGVDQRVWPEC